MIIGSTEIVVCQNSWKDHMQVTYVTKCYKYKEEFSTKVDPKKEIFQKNSHLKSSDQSKLPITCPL